MTSPKQLLDAHDIQPKKSLGQNFIHDPNTLEKIVASAELSGSETVIEIGPGTGAMTAILARQAEQVVAVEIDTRLEPLLTAAVAGLDNVRVVFADVLGQPLPQVAATDSYVVVANIPYYISSRILSHALESEPPPGRMILTVQYELAERIIARPGDMNLLAVSVQFFGSPHIVARIKPSVFWPRPDVDSAILRIDTHTESPLSVPVPDRRAFFRVARAGFSQKRKQLKNALGGGLAIKAAQAGELLDAAGIDPKRRAETLSLDEWAKLTHTLTQAGVV